MYQQVYASDSLDITYRTDACLIIARWLQPVAVADIRSTYEQVLRAAQPYGCRYWLLDIRRRNHSDDDTARWVTDEFFPGAAQQLGGVLYLAVLLSPMYLYEVGTRPRLAQLPAEVNPHYRIQYFTDERQANDWLTDKLDE
ncbi:hypothetical protein [Hymenobacter chitinivorans]|uniref:SpoIIAA-like protein n=1 Tax=Hymenobacter chitinivorans DSM 11115 TaxID=1121954 RepID=A0A2M9BAN2_9BACT|nr:hypothetical protein [Hymenobacter chitinivorans]PJJ55010.1 hypothetical protein CLV45_3359 [Hymenobacter chitinivorans DSM 11115]